jgi:hypothetical protein
MWEGNNYELALELHCAAAESEYVRGKTDNNVHFYVDEVLKHGRTIQHKVPVFYVLALSMRKQGRFIDSNNLCVNAFDQLKNIKIPRNELVVGCRTLSGLFSTKMLLIPANVVDLPLIV